MNGVVKRVLSFHVADTKCAKGSVIGYGTKRRQRVRSLFMGQPQRVVLFDSRSQFSLESDILKSPLLWLISPRIMGVCFNLVYGDELDTYFEPAEDDVCDF
jgi:hypothetical protein